MIVFQIVGALFLIMFIFFGTAVAICGNRGSGTIRNREPTPEEVAHGKRMLKIIAKNIVPKPGSSE